MACTSQVVSLYCSAWDFSSKFFRVRCTYWTIFSGCIYTHCSQEVGAYANVLSVFAKCHRRDDFYAILETYEYIPRSMLSQNLINCLRTQAFQFSKISRKFIHSITVSIIPLTNKPTNKPKHNLYPREICLTNVPQCHVFGSSLKCGFSFQRTMERSRDN